jgi:hypothetical protein
MAAFVLFVVAVAGAVVVTDLVWENPTAGQITVFQHTITGYPEGWLLAIAAGLGFVVALLLVASVNSTKGRRARRKQLRRLRYDLEDQVATPEPSRPGGPLGLARTGTARSRPARDAGGSGARRGSRRQGAARTRWSHAGATGLTAPD